MGTNEGFCIREYASRMRSVNVVRCWPFGEGNSTDEQAVRSLLPPITVKKFNWWLDELQHLAKSNSDADAAGAGEVVKVKSLRSKSKAPKKRSILEIFAVAPEVERVSSDGEERIISEAKLSGCEEIINWGHKGKRNKIKKKKKKKKKTEKIKNDKEIKVLSKLKAKKVIKNKRQIGSKVDLSAPDKENCFLLKLHDQHEDKGSGNPNSSFTRELGNDTSDHVSFHVKKTRPPCLAEDKKTLACKDYRLISQNRHPENPILSILKNQSAKGVLQEFIQPNSKEKADKHVTFLPKDGIHRMNISKNGVYEDFTGLPLNSHGELITFSSSTSGAFNHMISSSTAAAPSVSFPFPSNHSKCTSWDCTTTSSRQQSNLSPMTSSLKRKSIAFVPSVLDATESGSYGKTSLDYLENSLCLKGSRIVKSQGSEKILSTMRLMGKEFIVVEDAGYIRTEDKRIVDEHCFINAMMRDKTLFCPSEITNNAFPLFDSQTSSLNQNGFVASETNHFQKSHHGFSAGPSSSSVYHNEALFPEPFTSGSMSRNFGSMKKNLPDGAISAIRFPFMDPPALEGHVRTYWSTEGSYVDGSRSFFDVPDKETPMSGYHSYGNLGDNIHSLGTCNGMDSSLSIKPEAFCLYNAPGSFVSTTPSSTGPRSSHPTSLTQQQAPMLGILP